MFLVSSTTLVARDFGIMASPSVGTVYQGIEAGMPWAADCEAFTGRSTPERFLRWLEGMAQWRDTCLFAVCPDVMGDAEQTQRQFDEFAPILAGWPVAFVAQDGQEHRPLPDAECLFVGGTTAWKLGPGAIRCIEQADGRHVHIGRVNRWRRYRTFSGLKGSDDWTCDGTTHRFMGLPMALANWRSYTAEPVEPYLDLFGSDSGG